MVSQALRMRERVLLGVGEDPLAGTIIDTL